MEDNNPSTNQFEEISAFIQVKDELGIIRRCGGCEKHGISVHAIYQEPIRNSENMPFVLVPRRHDTKTASPVDDGKNKRCWASVHMVSSVINPCI